MHRLPDFPPHPYQVLRTLGQNQAAGRITYLASHLDTTTLVVIKKLPLPGGYLRQAVGMPGHREIQILKGLQHPGIPQYLDSFLFGGALYLVQEYKDAPNLTERFSFHPEEIKTIVVRLLSILVYLQRHIPPVVHGDIKPENILLRTNQQGDLDLFLVDFGLARTSADIPSPDSAGMGTFGFIPPEQMRRQLTRASDLYAVGATLICLLSGTATQDIHTLTHPDEPHRFEFRDRLLAIDSNFSPRFLDWLDRMVEPNLRDRFQDAQTALQVLRPLPVVARARVCLSSSAIHIQAAALGPAVVTTLQIRNPTPDTVLQGRCIITRLPYDDGDWITPKPPQFMQNQVNVQLVINPQRLRANTTYVRELMLESNGERGVIAIPVFVHTPALVPPRRPLPRVKLVLLLGISIGFPFTIAIAVSAML